jgi:hypothetical protein
MRRQPLRQVVAEHADQLRAQLRRIGDVGWHHAEERVLWPYGEDGAHRLYDLARREARQSALHDGNQVAHREQRCDMGFGEQPESL